MFFFSLFDRGLATRGPDGFGSSRIIRLNPHLPMQKLPKIAPSNSSLVTSPVISPSAR